MSLLQRITLNNISLPLKFNCKPYVLIAHFFIWIFIASEKTVFADEVTIKWFSTTGNAMKQKPDFYKSDEGIRIAEVLLLYQRDSGGWPRNYDRTEHITPEAKKNLLEEKQNLDSTFDNGSTYTEMRYLAKVYMATVEDRYKEAFLKGLEFTLEAQYENGGWPQFYPEAKGYQTYITYNDDAMIGIMRTLKEIANDESAYPFVPIELRKKSIEAIGKGVQCILKTQIKVDGKRTVWCAQYDEKLLVPGKARSYELVSLSGSESVGIVRFLMELKRPTQEVIGAIQDAITWFDSSKIQGIRQTKEMTDAGWNKIIIEDPTAPPMWARFYDIDTNKPIFSSRDGIPKDSMDQISFERRNGYSWLGYYPASLLAKDYPIWQKKWVPNNNVLK